MTSAIPFASLPINRRRLAALSCAAAGAIAFRQAAAQLTDSEFKFRYLLGSCLYGYADLKAILPQVSATGATAIDIWPMVHGNQREQIDRLGEQGFLELLKRHDVAVGCLTHFKLGPFALSDEMGLAQRLGCRLIVTGGKGPRNLHGQALKQAVGVFAEQMKPHLERARRCDVTIAIENHGNNLIDSPDSLKWLIDLCDDPHLGIALAPYHLTQDANQIARLIHDIGDRLSLFYAWQHGHGATDKLPKAQELMQLPGRGDMDFTEIVAALRDIRFAGWTEVFMHPVPRGVPILESPEAVTDAINQSRAYLERQLHG